jgi:hypothetical protein
MDFNKFIPIQKWCPIVAQRAPSSVSNKQQYREISSAKSPKAEYPLRWYEDVERGLGPDQVIIPIYSKSRLPMLCQRT